MAKQPHRILVVGDEPDVAEVLAAGLEVMGFEVTVASSGDEALLRLSEEAFEAMLTDVHMPRMRGDELQRRARAADPDLAVLMITAASDASLAVECLKEGVFDYMAKPFNLKDVAARVEKAIERRALIQENRAHQSDLEARVAEQASEIREVFQSSLRALNHALEAKDEYTRNHSFHVSELSVALAKRLRPSAAAYHEMLRVAALFHDIGKIGVPEVVLNKPGKLTEEEFAHIQKHPEIGETILRPLFADPDVLSIIRNHHERWDGGGYPDGLKGEAIPFGARIVAVADSYDAMTSARSYRAGMDPERALDILAKGAGTQWDPEIVGALLGLADADELTELANRPSPSLKDEDALGRSIHRAA